MNLTLIRKKAMTIGLLAASSIALSGHPTAARQHATPTVSSRHTTEADDAGTTDRAELMAHAAGSDRHLENLSAEIARRTHRYHALPRYEEHCPGNPLHSLSQCAV